MRKLLRASAQLAAACVLLAACGTAAPPPPPTPLPGAPVLTATASASAPADAAPSPGARLTADELHMALAALNSTLDRILDPRRAEVVEIALEETMKLRNKAAPAERALLERGLQLQRDFRAVDLENFAKGDPELLARLGELDRAWAVLYPDDPWPRMWLAKALRNITVLMVFRDFDSARMKEREREGNEIVKVLADKFPNDAFVQAERADVCLSEKGDRLDCMRRYARCLALEPKMQACIERLDTLREQYVAPYCAAADIKPALRAHVATPKPRSAAKETIELGGKKLTVEPAFLGAADIDEIDSIPFRTSEGERKTTVDVLVSAAKRAAVLGVHEAIEREDAYLVLFDGTKKLGTGRSYDIMLDGGVVSWRKDVQIEQVCKKVSQRTLPADLAPTSASP